MDHPPLPDNIVVLPGTDVEKAWTNFYPFEVLHHLHTICNPLSSDELDNVADALAPSDGDRALDIACGHGELLHRLTERARLDATGVDLSPWALLRARDKTPRATWWLGDGAEVPERREWDIVACLGASWIWDGFAGTVKALTARTLPGGRIAIGDLRLRSLEDRTALGDAPEAAALTEFEQLETLRSLDIDPVDQIIPSDSSWESYHDLVVESARAYVEAHPDDPGADYTRMAESWKFDNVIAHVTWTVWVADVR
jgi:SAM-dependent methyltransferase